MPLPWLTAWGVNGENKINVMSIQTIGSRSLASSFTVTVLDVGEMGLEILMPSSTGIHVRNSGSSDRDSTFCPNVYPPSTI